MTQLSKAVIFDLDGVLLDSREMVFQAFEYVLSTHGIQAPPRAEIGRHIGEPLEVIYGTMAPGLDAKVLIQEHLTHHESHLGLLSAYPEAKETLEWLTQKQYKIGIFTGFNELTKARLQQLNLLQYIDIVVDSTQYTKHKPDPEGLVLAMQRLEVLPQHVAYVGDSPMDIYAGKAANVAVTIAITHGFTSATDLAQAQPDYCINTLSELKGCLNS